MTGLTPVSGDAIRVALVDGDTVERVQEVLHLDKDQAQQLLHTLQQEGYVEPDRRFPQRDMCRTTTKGNALAMASATLASALRPFA